MCINYENEYRTKVHRKLEKICQATNNQSATGARGPLGVRGPWQCHSATA